MGYRQITGAALAGAVFPAAARAHVSEQGFVLLLPTDIYIAAGVGCVVLTVLLTVFLPVRAIHGLFRPFALLRFRPRGRAITGLLATLLLFWLIREGFSGLHDPLSNPLPLVIWTIWWLALVSLQGLLGNLWSWLNPWLLPVLWLRRQLGLRTLIRLPRAVMGWGAVLGYLAFYAFLLADLAPSDPDHLARVILIYWLAILAGGVVLGPRWLLCGEAITVLMRSYARLGLFGRKGAKAAMGLWGWQVLRQPVPGHAAAVFMLILLGSGSFDGLNETFWWFGLLGLNPLEFPGRSAVVAPSIWGLLFANAALIAIYAGAVALGVRLAGQRGLGRFFRLFAPSILPIALGYHIAHYLTVFLVDGQYVLKMMNDPLRNGAELLGMDHYHVTTGFLHTESTVRMIWLTQAGAVVVGHVVAILLAHALALRAFDTPRRAVLSQLPLSIFMVAYTFFGLWLLASPRGM